MMKWRLRPTWLGVGFIVVVCLLLLIAINFSNNLIFTFSFFLISVLMISVWLLIRNIRGIEVSHVRARPVHQGQKIQFQVAVKERVGADHLYLELNDSVGFYHLEAGQERTWKMEVSAAKRGLLPEQPLVLSCLWPLGLFKLSVVAGALPETLIYPEAATDAPLPDEMQGQNAHAQSEAEELDGLREYQAGDNVKRIDWRAYSRRQQLQVKHFDGAQGEPSLWLEWQATQGLAYEQRISHLCHWVLECQQSGREFGLRLPDREITPQRDGQHVQGCLAELALMPEEGVQ